eukprot:CAMPEP_0204513388 /NCGR_PEP_ID=MMETSP0661-20131031/1475_1 /ASSEMBLY_ACC=CAM_ASM_000606 /TAXON_ID=109239 /ORGANISM="Alexandrium margalefi, Strain AMGDE01CS-322" /LENGTH=438 /DNA_ID=CAMNT_0051518561 /DNA_START=21 /DNA_END=1337 /DNA_ORIENTATION=+
MVSGTCPVSGSLKSPLLAAAHGLDDSGPFIDPETGHVPETMVISERSLALAANRPKDTQQMMTTSEASFAMASFLLNFGLFSVPLAFVRTGWAAIGVIVLAGGMCLSTGLLLGRVLERLQLAGISQPTYRDAARVAAGERLATLMTSSCLLELATYAWGNQIVLTNSVAQLLPGVDRLYIVAVSSVISLFLSAVPDKAYAYVSLTSSLCIAMSCAMVLVSGLVLPEWAHTEQVFHGVDSLPLSFSLVVFGAAAHPCLPMVFHNTGSRSDFDVAIRNGWALWTACAIGFGAMTYYMFGDAVQVLALENIGRDLEGRPLPEAEWLKTFAVAWVVFKMQGSQVPISRPFMEVVARAAGTKTRRGNGGLACLLLSVPAFLVIGAGAVLLEDHIGALECVTGSALMTLNAFVFPTMVYVLICRAPRLDLPAGAPETGFLKVLD